MEMIQNSKKDPYNSHLDNKDIANWFSLQQYKSIQLSKEHKIICNNCKTVEEFSEFKQPEYLPKCFVISLNRGENYNNTFQPTLRMVLDLTEAKLKLQSKYYIYDLVGIMKRMINSKGDEYFIAIYKDQQNNTWKITDRDKVKEIKYPLSHKEGLIVTLFYSPVINIGQ